MSNVLVTGSCGFIGGRLATKLADEGHCVIGLVHDLERFTATWNVPGDVTDYARMLEIIVDHEIDYIYHLAGKSVVKNCNADPLNCFRVNALGTVTVLEAARQSGRIKGVMCAESDKAYGTTAVPYKEDMALNPGGVYEASKSCVSQIIPAYFKTYGVPCFGIRSANVYGPGDRHLSRLIPGTITRILDGKMPVITAGAAEYVREFIYVGDAIDAMTGLMAKEPWGQSVNVASGEKYNIASVVSHIETMMEVPRQWDTVPRADTFKEIREQHLCLDRLKKLLPKFKPSLLSEKLPETIGWYRCNH